MVDDSPPWSISGTISTASISNSHFVCPTALPLTLCPCNPLGWPTVRVPFSLMFSPLKSQVAGSTGHPDKRALWGALGRASRCHSSCRLHQPRPSDSFKTVCTRVQKFLCTCQRSKRKINKQKYLKVCCIFYRLISVSVPENEKGEKL